MPFLGIDEHGIVLQNALLKLRRLKRSITRLSEDMNKLGYTVSRSHINAFLNADLSKNRKEWEFEPLAKIFNFLETSPDYAGLIEFDVKSSSRSDNYFFSSAYRYFCTPFDIKYSYLSSLIGQYAMFRPLWSSAVEDFFVRSIVTIEDSGDAFLFREEQSYEDPFHVQVNEVSLGYIFPFGSVLFSITNEEDYKCRRFICMHTFTAALNKRKSSTNKFYGEIKSISAENAGPPAHKFVCRRIRDDILDCSVIRGSGLLEEDQYFFGVKREAKRRKKS